MAFGLGTLGLASAAFWAMSPREIAAAARAHGLGAAAMVAPTRAGLDALMARFPD